MMTHPPFASSKFNDPPLCEGSKSSDPPPICSAPPPPIFIDQSLIISYCMLSLHIITFPQGYVGALRSNINKTKHQILIKHKFV